MQLPKALVLTAICTVLTPLVGADEPNSIEARQRKTDLSFCFSNDSICTQATELYDQCSDLQDNFKDLNPYYECVCTSGYTSISQACNWCQAAYNLTYTVGLVEDQIETCQSLSYSIAPIPSQILAIQSSFNATYTGNVPGANGGSNPITKTGSASSPAASGGAGSVTSGSATATTSSTPRIGISATTASSFLSTVTLNGGANGAGATRSSTTSNVQQQSATSTPSATPTGAASGGRNRFAVGLSILISTILGLVMV